MPNPVTKNNCELRDEIPQLSEANRLYLAARVRIGARTPASEIPGNPRRIDGVDRLEQAMKGHHCQIDPFVFKRLPSAVLQGYPALAARPRSASGGEPSFACARSVADTRSKAASELFSCSSSYCGQLGGRVPLRVASLSWGGPSDSPVTTSQDH